MASIVQNLRKAKRDRSIINFSSRFESGSFTGYVMDVGAVFFIFAVLGEGLEFVQFACLRSKDVRRLESPAKNEAFYQKVRKLRGDKMPRNVNIDVTNIASIVD